MLRPFDLIFWYNRFRLWKAGFHRLSVVVQGQACRYWVGGRGSPLLLVHGLGGSTLQDFTGIACRLAPRHRVIGLDLPGFGFSQHVRIQQSVANQAAFLHDFLDAVHVEKIHVLGNSMGGWIALKLVHQHPDRVHKLILTATAGIRFDPPLLEIFTPEDEAAMFRLLSRLFYRLPPMPRWFVRDWLRVLRQRHQAVREMLNSMMTGEDLLDNQLASIRIPTLVLWGQHDQLIPLEVGHRLVSMMPHARLEILPTCGHLLLHEDPDGVMNHLGSWLE